MRCRRCGSDAKEGWKFCPSCGSAIEKPERSERPRESDLFTDVFERMEKEMGEMNRSFERNFEVIDLSPFFQKSTKPLRGSGFSIRISHSGDGKPKVDVQTFGDVNRKQVESEASRLGFRERLAKTLRPERPREEAKPKGVCFAGAKTTEEPETCVRNVAGRIVADIKLLGVKNAGDIEIRQLENSIEVRAIAGDKAYFKILTKPPQKNIANQGFSNGVLKIEFA